VDVRGEVVAGTGDGDGVQVGGVQLDAGDPVLDGQSQCPRPTTEIHHDDLLGLVVLPLGAAYSRVREPDLELAADAREEDAGAHAHPDPAEVGVADHLLERLAQRTTAHQSRQRRVVRGGAGQHGGLVLGEDTTGLPQRDHRRGDRRCSRCHQPSLAQKPLA
jgi:hypothetical protein